jgi:hypothetical protein
MVTIIPAYTLNMTFLSNCEELFNSHFVNIASRDSSDIFKSFEVKVSLKNRLRKFLNPNSSRF